MLVCYIKQLRSSKKTTSLAKLVQNTKCISWGGNISRRFCSVKRAWSNNFKCNFETDFPHLFSVFYRVRRTCRWTRTILIRPFLASVVNLQHDRENNGYLFFFFLSTASGPVCGFGRNQLLTKKDNIWISKATISTNLRTSKLYFH